MSAARVCAGRHVTADNKLTTPATMVPRFVLHAPLWEGDDAERAMAVPRPRDIFLLSPQRKEPPRACAPHGGRMTCPGRSPGSRVITFLRLPGPAWQKPSGNWRRAR